MLGLNGGDQTLASYPKTEKKFYLQTIPAHHWEFMENLCVNYWETENHFFVHGNVDPQLPLNQQPRTIIWGKISSCETPYFRKNYGLWSYPSNHW